jgi:hypothetical protein
LARRGEHIYLVLHGYQINLDIFERQRRALRARVDVLDRQIEALKRKMRHARADRDGGGAS